MTQVTHDLLNAENHVGGITLLAHFTVHLRPYGQVLHIVDSVPSHQIGTHRCECVGTLTFRELPAALSLKGALGHVVPHGIARDIVEDFILRDILRATPDDDDQL